MESHDFAGPQLDELTVSTFSIHFADCGGCGGLANTRSILVVPSDTTSFALGCTRALHHLGTARKA